MQEIEFHLGLDDGPAYACRLLRKAWSRQLRAVVTGAPEALNRLDVLLWTIEPGAFIPHARLRQGQAPAALLLARTPIWLADRSDALPAADLLVNLGPALPASWQGFDRVVDLVADDGLDAGRQRWRQYKAAGCAPRDMRQAAGAAGGSAQA